MNDKKKLERPLYLDMPFGEALERFARTDPAEVKPAPGQKRKRRLAPLVPPTDKAGG